MTKEGLSGGTALIVHNIIRRALKIAVSRGRVGRDVALLVDTPPVQRSPEVVPLTVAEAKKILGRAAAQERNAARWSVALALGLRQGEALGAQWAQVDLVNGREEGPGARGVGYRGLAHGRCNTSEPVIRDGGASVGRYAHRGR